MSLVARQLEEAGIPTVILGSARDIVEHCGVPRFVFTDFPLGNPCGEPGNRQMQRRIVEIGLELIESARHPRTTVQSPFQWSGGDEWRAEYNKVSPENIERLRELGEQRRAERRQAREEGLARSG